MSIINDALKKVQINFKKKDHVPEKKPQPQPNQDISNVYEKLYKARAEQKNPSGLGREQRGKVSDKTAPRLRPAKKWLSISAVVIVFLLCSYGSLFLLLKFKPFKDFTRSIMGNNSSPRTAAARQAPKKRKYKPGELVLNGTSLIDGKRVALINDEIYQIGETINGKKIISISLNKTELSDNETIITLKVH